FSSSFVHCAADHSDLPSFPTRRSSDLGKPRLGEMPGLRGRIGVEDGRTRHLAAHQADAGAAFQIDRGVQDHRTRLAGITNQRPRSEEHTSELQSPCNLVCRLLLEKKKS